ncbi:hypothetical protein Tco_0176344, partial [Tanacetum coccineum]
EGDLRLIEELLNNDPSSPLPLSHNPLSGCTTSSSFDHLLEEFADELALITFPPGNDDLESDNDDVYDDPFDSKEDKIKESKLLIDELDPPRSSDFLPSPECDSVFYEDFIEVDTLTSTDQRGQ